MFLMKALQNQIEQVDTDSKITNLLKCAQYKQITGSIPYYVILYVK